MTLYTEQLILGNLHMNLKTRNFQPDKVQNEDWLKEILNLKLSKQY